MTDASAEGTSAGLHDDPEGRRMPDFLGIGAQKAGTTWLWHNLRLHPGVYMPRRKELHYLDQHWDLGYEWYLRHFAARRVRRRLAGEITPNYLVVDVDRIAAMHRINADLALLVMIREPVDRAWSAARYFARNQLETSIESLPIDEFRELVQAPNFADRGDYATGIERWESVFGPDRIHVEFYDDIMTQPAETFVRVCRFLGLSTDLDLDTYDFETVFNPGPKAAIPAEHQAILEAQNAGQRAWLADRFRDRAIPWLTEPTVRLEPGAE